jgi:hypothetical protein
MVVVVAGSPGDPEVLARDRVEMVDFRNRSAVQPYHAAAELPSEEASRLIDTSLKDATRGAQQAIQQFVTLATRAGFEVSRCAIVTKAGRKLPELSRILTAHPLIHTAEGEHFREAFAQAAVQLGMTVHRIPERELKEAVSAQTLESIGKKFGPPWNQDVKTASVAAWMASSQSARSKAAAH